MKSIITSIGSGIQSLTTYNFGIVQNKVFRQLKQRTTKVLSESDITTNEWAVLGFLYDNVSGIRPGDIALTIGVERPLITLLCQSLEDKQYITLTPDVTDSRAKKICLTDAGRRYVEDMEPKIRADMRIYVKGISLTQLYTYYTVMKKMSKNLDDQE